MACLDLDEGSISLLNAGIRFLDNNVGGRIGVLVLQAGQVIPNHLAFAILSKWIVSLVKGS